MLLRDQIPQPCNQLGFLLLPSWGSLFPSICVLEPQTLATPPPIVLACGQPNRSASEVLLRPAPQPDQAILWEHIGWERLFLLKGPCHKPLISGPARWASGRSFWLPFLPISLFVHGFPRFSVLSGIWGRASDLGAPAQLREGWQLAEGQGMASPTAHKESQ